MAADDSSKPTPHPTLVETMIVPLEANGPAPATATTTPRPKPGTISLIALSTVGIVLTVILG